MARDLFLRLDIILENRIPLWEFTAIPLNVEYGLVYFWILVEMNKGDGLLFIFSNLKL